MVAAVTKNSSAIPEVTSDRFAQLKEQSSWFRSQQILKMLDVLAQAERDLRFTNQHRLLLEKSFWSILPSALATFPVPDAAVAARTVEPPRTTSNLPVVRPIPPDEPAVSAEIPAFTGSLDLDGIRRIWPRVYKRVAHGKPAAASVLEGVHVLSVQGNVVTLGFPKQFSLERAERPQSRELLEKALCEELKTTGLKVRCRLDEAVPDSVPAAQNAALEFSAANEGHSGNGASADSEALPISESVDETSILKAVEKEFGDKLLPE
jgi:DNA polymerase-3 subunit gamma/tau